MSRTAFRVAIFLVVALVLLSSMNFPGALIGFFCGVAVAFFISPLTFLLQGIARAAGFEIAFEQVVVVLPTLYGVAVLAAVYQIRQPYAAGDERTTRSLTFRALVLAVLPLVAWLSSQALMRAWP